ncbi:helix-turn-helix domain-containing protein [Actinokineospora bangkokensis]|uniref:Uncharacterized protein n=1 Tax=Actinokineospora bangkokensis TaxID=1193682 RepID=A0A1Q9LMB2_9PSEU|nr:helix-turn-helix transcriptional regulator [Actinokineospora bangkokensis]OLR93172.1 hypothetical protein BJP25_16875 [Actinokineospora bangkokensis]
MAPPRRSGGGREVAWVLRNGSFAEALDAAIRARGLTLDRLRYHLAEQGMDVSAATLSYWRHNRRRPEKPESLRAVRALEGLLGVPADSLITLLGPPRPRGRWVNRGVGAAGALMAQFDDPDEGVHEVVSAHDVFTVAGDRSERGVRSRLVLRGTRGLVTRRLVKYQADDPEFPPELIDVRFCRTGRVRSDPAAGLIVVELLLDRALGAGEHAVVEYEVAAKPGPPVEHYYRQLTHPMAEYSQQIQFEGPPPAWCHGFRQRALSGPEERTEPLPVGPSGSSCLVGINLPPGVVGTRWAW